MKKKPLVENVIVERLSPSLDEGLSSTQVSERISSGNTNAVSKKYSKSYLSIFCSNVFTFFNLLGLIVTVALICIGASITQFFYVLIYFSNILIGIILEIRAKHCIDKLSLLSSSKIDVIRDGKEVCIDPKEIVLDDVIKLKMGVQIPTDSIVASGSLEVNESLLTGESIAIKKKVGDILYAGSIIVAGNCLARANKVGKDNYIEQLSEKAKEYKKPHSELMKSLHLIIKIIGMIIIPIAIAMILKNTLWQGTALPEAIDRTCTVIIGMIPSGMFLLTSMALAVGVIKLATHNTLVQDLYSLEMLARVDTICFDKTGTITDGKMTVQDIIKVNEDVVEFDKLNDIISSMIFALNDDNQTAIALKNKFGEQNVYNCLEAIPFNSERKFCAVSFENEGTFAYGAPEFVLSKEKYSKLRYEINKQAKNGLRVLVVAKSSDFIVDGELPQNFDACALILIADNVRPEAASTVEWFKENNVNIKVISGDNPITVSEVSGRVGIDGYDNYVSLEGLTDQEVYDIADKYTVFGRVSPEQKAILIKSIREHDHVVAMTGDGVNDILAMKEANCAVSVASGSDAARNLAHLVLLDDNFNNMPKIVYEGRRVINNVQSSASLYLMKTLFTMIMAIITLCSTLPSYPFQLNQMILLEVFVIGLPSFFLSLQENKALVEGKFIKQVLIKSLPSALLMVLSYGIIELIEILVPMSLDGNILQTIQLICICIAGLVSLFMICLPLNKYRSVLFFTNFAVVLGIIIYSMFFGLNIIGLSPLTPFLPDNYKYLYIVLTLLVLDIPFFLGIRKICELASKIKFKRKKKNDQKTTKQ